MVKIEVLQSITENEFITDVTVDGVTKRRIMTLEEIRADFISGNKNVYYIFDTNLEFDFVQVDFEEGIYYIYLVSYIFDSEGGNVKDKLLKTYKRYSNALNHAYKVAGELDTIVSILD